MKTNKTYSIYGEPIVKDDSSLNSFCHSLVDTAQTNLEAEGKVTADDMEDAVEELIEALERTDIDYQELMRIYAPEIGPVLYRMDNEGFPMPAISFFDGAKDTFEVLVSYLTRHIIGIMFWEDNPSILFTCTTPELLGVAHDYCKERISDRLEAEGRDTDWIAELSNVSGMPEDYVTAWYYHNKEVDAGSEANNKLAEYLMDFAGKAA